MSDIVIIVLCIVMLLSGVIFIASALMLDRSRRLSRHAGDKMLWIMAVSGTATVSSSVLTIILTKVLERS